MTTNDEEKKEMPMNFWVYDIHPILGYKWDRQTLNPQPARNKYEYNKEDDVKL